MSTHDIDTGRRSFLKHSGAVLAVASSLPLLAQAAPFSTAQRRVINHPLTKMTALELSEAIHQRRASCVEVMRAYLDKIAILNPKVNAIVSLREEKDLLAEAARCDEELKKGESRGWMHGFPIAIKDLSVPTKGIRTTSGSPLFANYVPDFDGLLVERIRHDGAIIIGKTNVPEFGLGSHTYNPIFGTTYNAWDQRVIAGGSSGGAAVALALQMVPVADGSDMMGSLRNPAAYNNVIGFRPSQGLVPAVPAVDVFMSQLGYAGPMGRTVSDAARLLGSIAGRHTRSPLSMVYDTAPLTQPLEAQRTPLRIGWLADVVEPLAIEPEVLALCQRALGVLKDMGHTVTDATLGVPEPTIWSSWLTLRQSQAAGSLGQAIKDPATKAKLKPELVWEVEEGLKLSAADVYRANKDRTTLYEAFAKLYQEFDILVLPTAQMFPFDATQHWPKEVAGRPMDTYHRWMEVVAAVSLAGLPALNVPVGFGRGGLPMGMQLIGPHLADLAVLQIGHAYEQVTRWNLDHVPPLLRS